MKTSPRYPRVTLCACLAILVSSCGGDGPTDPPFEVNQPGVHVVLGANVTDTIDAPLLQALVVEVRGPDGELAQGAVVRFESQPTSNTSRPHEPAIYVCALTASTCGPDWYGTFSLVATDTTDATGRAKAIVRLGAVAGAAVVRVYVPEFGMVESATYTVTPGAAVRVQATAADTALNIGGTATLSGRVVDRYGNMRPEVPTIAAGTGNAITADAASSTVTGREMGTQWLFTRHASLVDSSTVRVVPSGRLLLWSPSSQTVRLVNTDGSDGNGTIISGVASDMGVFPRFTATGRSITLHTGTESWGGPPNRIVVIDTTGAGRRNIGPTSGFSMVISVRQLADGTVLVVGRREGDAPSTELSVWRVASDNAITSVASLPGMSQVYGGADISPNGTRVAYVVPWQYAPPDLRVVDLSTGAVILVENNATSPRWSSQGDRLAFLVPVGPYYSDLEGPAVVMNADGTGKRDLGSGNLSPGLAWSPDGKYLVGRSSESSTWGALRLLRVSDGANVLLRFREDYYQPDWQ